MRLVTHGLLICLLSGPAWADQLAVTPDERQALIRLDQAKYKDARRLAESSLKQKKTMIAQYVMGVVHAEYEGNLARGLFFIRQSKKALFKEHGTPPAGVHPKRWHRRILMREQAVLGMMDQRTEQLKTLDQHDDLYRPKQTARRIWPLLKLGRFDEARTIGKSLIHHERPEVRERAYNGLMAVEEESGHREASYKWGRLGLVDTRGESCVIATNLALGARRTFRFTETIEHDQAALKSRDRSCPTSPHAQLAAMYLVFGEFQKCLSSLKALRAAPRDGDMRVQNEMVIKARFVELLYALGAFEEATIRARQVIEEPDRAGMVSTSAETVELTNNVLAWSVFDARHEMLEEMISARPFMTSIPLRVSQQKISAIRWRARREAMRLGAMPDLITKTVRPYYTDVMPWYGGAMLSIFGEGVISKAMLESRQLERDYTKDVDLFFDAYRGESAWRRADLTAASTIGHALLKRLPKDVRLLRMRVHAWLADTLQRQGRQQEAADHFHAVMDFYPTVLRHLRIPLPVSFIESTSPHDLVKETLQNSPRLVETDDAPFKVRIDRDGDGIVICLEGQKRFGCGRYPSHGDTQHVRSDKAGQDSEARQVIDPVVAVIDSFHNDVFSPRIDLSQSDINSLDGRAVRGDAKGAIDALLGREKRGKKRTP
jgi:hypothetical protein